ncbi:hypothetical protein BV22DRAFT_1194256 [Leucogyrophana mollusca]|uniref:Uncharacterized protein n=1 Tax=Leucogyrophana mollusca TaxID=85980 RepID=A0ACB8BL10_9AGAM|nr:hypothetical protein BV22DRAFT_1194256 [Leucogyrophana mollusca]
MLVVHPSSLCDVCLDPYSISSEPANAPHAIACGHIFCLTCLRSLAPSACPLCRKAFQPDRVKKLHVAGPPELDDSTEDAYNARLHELLQRVALVSGENEPEENVVQVVTEVDDWLASQSDDPDSARALRAAVGALQRYKALLDLNERERLEFRRLRHQLRSSKRNADHDIKTSRVVEESLLTRIQEIENEHATEVNLSRLQAELDSLRNEQSRFRNNGNPLPHPPEPLPMERFGVRNGIDTTFPTGENFPEAAPRPYLPGPEPRRKAAVNGTTAPVKEQGAPQTTYAPVAPRQRPPEAARTEERPVWVADRPAREPEDSHAARPGRTQVGPHPMDPGAARRMEADRIPTSRMHFVPGATREQRFIPPIAPSSPSWTIHTERGAGPRLDDEEESRRRVVEWERTRAVNGANNSSTRAGIERTMDVEARLASAAAYVNGYGSGYESGYSLARGVDVRPSSYERSHSFPVQESPEQVVGGLGLTGVPYPPPNGTVISHEDQDDIETPRNRASLLTRRHTVNTTKPDRTARGVDAPPEIPADRATRRPPAHSVNRPSGLDNAVAGPSTRVNGAEDTAGVVARRPRGLSALIAPLAGENDSPRSETTWGTVHTVSRSSMSELGLIGLQNGGVRGEGSVAGDSVIGRDEVLDENESDEDDGIGTDNGSGTPMMPGGFTAVGGDGSVLGLILEDDGDYARANDGRRPRQRSTSYTEMPPHPVDDHRSQRQRRPERNGRPHQHRRHTSQPTSSDTIQPHPQAPSNGGGFGNALSLSFDASLPVHGYPAFPAPPPPYPGSGYGREIIAPTPIVGGPNVAHLWANRT